MYAAGKKADGMWSSVIWLSALPASEWIHCANQVDPERCGSRHIVPGARRE
jgi:hypothetical protein